jgi:hypothetical protein
MTLRVYPLLLSSNIKVLSRFLSRDLHADY